MRNSPPRLVSLPVVPQPPDLAQHSEQEFSVRSFPQLDRPSTDWLSVEEPLEISLEFDDGEQVVRKPISITMRTPGHDLELAIGFLVGEGIITSADQIADHHLGANRVLIKLADHYRPEVTRLNRHFYTSSSCGVCGKATLEALETVVSHELSIKTQSFLAERIVNWPDILRMSQRAFDRTGGIHAAGLFQPNSQLEVIREDVGRHNAVDKLVGYAVLHAKFPLADSGLLVSGRASFELVQKAVMAGIPLLAAVGAPSSLAVELAKRFRMTLIGFLRNGRFNIYHDENRLDLSRNTHG